MKNSDFKFLGYRVSQFSMNIDDSVTFSDDILSQEINIETNFSDEDRRFVELVLNIAITSETGKIQLHLQLKGAFKANDKMSDKVFDTLARQNAPAILFPYARAIISNYTVQANLPPIILPVINFVNDTGKENLP